MQIYYELALTQPFRVNVFNFAGMDWKAAISGFKNYLKLERSMSPNTVESYVRDVTQLKRYRNECH